VAIIIVLGFLLIGIFIITDYGQSWDEATNYLYGERALGYYLEEGFLQDPQEEYFHGTFYFMVWAQASKVVDGLVRGWHAPDGRHFVNYLTFLLGAIGFFSIAKSFFDKGIATVALLFYLTQPILFGHAFINQKDIPFMSFFVITLALGVAIGAKWTPTNGDRSWLMPVSKKVLVGVLSRLGRN
jgi:4-amino-4-deoxy-L-arabinose transferase-like glycosyltransferase